ncbi:MAG TPA: DUF87 domain-containing protein [Bryobacteraceae bacterium]|nr:DUF87 domain-containing protein [Bryobacteraceae bacterium]
MQEFEKLGVFYLGRETSPAAPLVLYDSKDLVTHAVCVGMTGSGKTGLCISLLEEAALDGVPAIAIDPKGDLSNLLLQFPGLTPAEFEPWLNEDDAKRENLTRAQYAEKQAGQWREGLAKWGEDGERIRKLRESADFAIYTPGSNAGLPLAVIKSLSAPTGMAADDRELIRDRISVTATAVLSLMGIEAEPLKSREHILLSTILDNSWKQGQDLSMEELIHQIQAPPVTRIGVLDLESFYPSKERFELAMALNNLIASPGFEAWMEGEPLDVERLLRTAEGKPRISILSISHLSETERMFFVSLLLNEVLSWTRTQPGTTSLRAILYMDEIFGFFPPVANPPSKRPLLTLLKQARAFGVGIVLATQNPVDLDYKGLANAGTWFIGRLQTERDKSRLMDGLEGASAESGRGFNRQHIEGMLAGLGKRVFLLNNVHEDAPVLFESRWALSYLRGPMTRNEIKRVMQGRHPEAAVPESPEAAETTIRETSPRVVLPPDIPQAFIPVRGSHAAIVYRPTVLAAAQIRYQDTKKAIDYLQESVFATEIKADSLPVQWEESFEVEVDPSDLESQPVPDAEFATLPGEGAKPKNFPKWNKELVTWIYGHQQLEIFKSPGTGLCSNPNESERDFRLRLQQTTRESRDQAVAAIRQKYAAKAAGLQERLRRAQQAVEREQEQSQQQVLQSAISIGSGILGAMFGRKTLSQANVGRAATAMRSVGRARKESQDVGRAAETVAAVQQQINELEAQVQGELTGLQARTDPMSEALERVCIKPKKTNISVRLFTLAWAPYSNEGGASTPAWQ